MSISPMTACPRRAEKTLRPKSPMNGMATYEASAYMPDPHETSTTGKGNPMRSMP